LNLVELPVYVSSLKKTTLLINKPLWASRLQKCNYYNGLDLTFWEGNHTFWEGIIIS